MLPVNQNNQFHVHGRVVRDPYVCRNRDGSIKITMTIAAEDEAPSPNGRKSFQFIPVETFYGKKYVGLYGDSVKNAVKKDDIVSAQGRLEMHQWTSNGQPRSKIVLLCLDTPTVIEPD